MVEVDFHPAPEWLNVAYLEPVLRKYQNDNTLEITELEMKPATAKGDNYASIMTRIRVSFRLQSVTTPQTENYIVKTSYENDPFVSNIMTPYDPYNTEMLMYEKILPQLTALLAETGDEDKLFADTVHVDYENAAIIFEDLAVLNYGLADRLIGMDLAHTKLALKKLAKMHAAAAVLNERKPGILEKFDRGLLNRHTTGFGPFFENMLLACADFAGECPELGSYYKEKLLRLSPRVVEYGVRVFDTHEGHFHTLNHGDYWVNNIMIRYDVTAGHENGEKQVAAKTIRDVKLIDFQFCHWGSPAVDLHYFLNTSLPNELRLLQQDALVQYYHQILTYTLRRLAYSGYTPSLHEFCVQLEQGRLYAVTSALVQHPMMTNDKTDDADFRALMMDDQRARNYRKTVYNNKVVQENVKALLPIFERRGLLDVTD